MKLAFSTVSCPNWSLNEIISTASDFLYDGIEVRGIGNELYAPRIPELQDTEKVKNDLRDYCLTVSCLASNACLAVREDAVCEAKDYIDFAEKLDVKYVRVLGTGSPFMEEGDYGKALAAYTEICRYGEKKGVTPIMETNGMFADTALLRKFMYDTQSENKGVLWDVNHPYRFHREGVKETLGNIGEFIKNVHMKDSKLSDGALKYKLIGYGSMPIKEIVSELKNIRYDGFLTLEWVKRWNTDIEEPSVIIPLYSSFIRNLL